MQPPLFFSDLIFTHTAEHLFPQVRSMSNSLSRTMEGMASVGVGVGSMPVMPPEYFHTAEATRLAAQVRDGRVRACVATGISWV